MVEASTKETDPLKGLTFERGLADLEALVKRFETGSLTLDQAVQSYETAFKLKVWCQEQLSACELRIQHLSPEEKKEILKK